MKKHPGQRSFGLTRLAAYALLTGTLLISACGQSAALRSANEAAAIQTLMTLAVNQKLYYKSHGGNSYGTFDQLISDISLDKKFAGDAPVINGYIFSTKIIPKMKGQPPFYSINADPQQSEGADATGTKHFYIDSDSDIVKVNNQRPAGPSDPPLSE